MSRRLSSRLFRAARVVDDVESLSDPDRALRRARNRLVGRALGRLGVWRRLWR